MKQCDICGHAAERGSICHHCRAAIKRARDQTVSQFQGLPALALAGRDAGEVRVGRGAAKVRPVRAVRHARKTTDNVPPTRGSGLLQVPPATRSAPFVWVILTLMVLVVTYVAYRVITTAEAQPAEPSLVSAEPAVIPAPEKPPLDRGSLRAPAVLPAVPATVEPSVQASPKEPETPSQPRSEAPRVAYPQVTAHEPRPATRAKETPQRPTEPGSAARVAQSVAAPADSGAAPGLLPANAALPAVAPSPARIREPSRSDHWQRMATAIRNCSGSDFLGRLLCEQKVRIEYCEGWWGQAAECPNGLANDHGQ